MAFTQAVKREAVVVPLRPVAADPSPQTVAALFGDKQMGCRFLREEDPSDFAFCCGKPTLPGKSWCADHQSIVWRSYGQPFTEKSLDRAASYFGRL